MSSPKPSADEKARGVQSALAFVGASLAAVAIGLWFAFSGPVAPGERTSVLAETTAPVELTLAASLTDLRAVQPVHETDIASGKLERRDTLTNLLDRLGADRDDANRALYALYDTGLIDPRRVRPGLQVDAIFDIADARRLAGLIIRADSDRALTVSRNADGSYSARETFVTLTPTYRRVQGEIETSIYQAALEDGASDQQVVDFAAVFAYDVDFQREIRRGDTFEMVFESFVDERGRPVRNGDVVYAELNGQFTDRAFYRFTPEDDQITDYFDPGGESARKFLMKTPINGARLSSNFGMRRHPISGYSKMHRGTDFAAPTGTPVYAAGNGVVVRASRFGGYGNYVRIEHPNGYETAYAHLSRYGPGIKAGVRVRQGQIIGYVGSTGASTGPHLHYEVILNGKHVDAMSLKLPTGRKLDGGVLETFLTAKLEIDRIRRDLGAPIEIAEAAPVTNALPPR